MNYKQIPCEAVITAKRIAKLVTISARRLTNGLFLPGHLCSDRTEEQPRKQVTIRKQRRKEKKFLQNKTFCKQCYIK